MKDIWMHIVTGTIVLAVLGMLALLGTQVIFERKVFRQREQERLQLMEQCLEDGRPEYMCHYFLGDAR